MNFGDWRDEFTGTFRSDDHERLGERVDPDWPIDRPELHIRGGPIPADHRRCTCPCHSDARQGHCVVCATYWMPPISDDAVERAARALSNVRVPRKRRDS